MTKLNFDLDDHNHNESVKMPHCYASIAELCELENLREAPLAPKH